MGHQERDAHGPRTSTANMCAKLAESLDRFGGRSILIAMSHQPIGDWVLEARQPGCSEVPAVSLMDLSGADPALNRDYA
jgi:hypothetical protein